jgi:hypothetical protein
MNPETITKLISQLSANPEGAKAFLEVLAQAIEMSLTGTTKSSDPVVASEASSSTPMERPVPPTIKPLQVSILRERLAKVKAENIIIAEVEAKLKAEFEAKLKAEFEAAVEAKEAKLKAEAKAEAVVNTGMYFEARENLVALIQKICEEAVDREAEFIRLIFTNRIISLRSSTRELSCDIINITEPNIPSIPDSINIAAFCKLVVGDCTVDNPCHPDPNREQVIISWV